MHVSTWNICKTVIDITSITIANKNEVVRMRFPLAYLNVKVKVMIISTANISKIVTDTAKYYFHQIRCRMWVFDWYV